MIRTKASYYTTFPLPSKYHAEQRKRELQSEGYFVKRPVKTDEGWVLKFRRREDAK